MKDWQQTEIGEFVDFNPSERIPKGQQAKKIPMAMLTEFERKIKGFEIAEYQSGPKFRNGDTLVAKITPCLENGKTAKVDLLNEEEVAFGSTEFIVLRANGFSDSNFVYYMARSPLFREKAIGCMEGTSGRRRVNETALKLQEILVPLKEDQQKIASVLSALDDKIELNNRINTELEAMAKLIYEYWFVQFDFPNKEGKPYKASGGKMVWNEVLRREIPEGWADGQIGDLIFLEYGKPLKESDRSGKGFPVFGSNGIVGYHDNYLIEGPGIIVGRKGSAGEIQRTGENFFPIDTTYYVVDKLGVNSLVFHFQLLMRCNLKSMESSSAVPGLNRQIAHSIKTVVPPRVLIEQFSKIVEPFFKSIDSNKEQNQELANLRDWLLPMLMNGQVTVGEAAVDDVGLTTLYQTPEEELNVAAEAPATYEVETNQPLRFKNPAFSKQVLAGKVVSLFKDEADFTHIKFQKIQFLAEHIAEADLNLNYYYQSAGPYDNKFMHSIADKFRTSKWFNEQNFIYRPMDKLEQVDRYFQGDFKPKLEILNRLFNLLKGKTEAETEVLATTYAVWNNRLILNQPIGAQSLVEDFFKWSDRKHQYTADQVLDAIQWLATNGFKPTGFGKELKRAKK